MRFQVGRRPDGVDSVESALLDCHGRIRDLTGLAVRLGSSSPAAADEVVEAATRVMRYFSEALPRHEADEEESLRPRLSGLSEEIDAALADMTSQHHELHGFVDDLVELTSRIASDPTERHDVAVAESLAVVGSTLEGMWTRHLGLEEEVLFPAVSRLDESIQAEIRAEMRARRS